MGPPDRGGAEKDEGMDVVDGIEAGAGAGGIPIDDWSKEAEDGEDAPMDED